MILTSRKYNFATVNQIISNSYGTFPSAIWLIFSMFLMFYSLFHTPLCEGTVTYEKLGKYCHTARGYLAITGLAIIGLSLM